jgi:hypothetical protein
MFLHQSMCRWSAGLHLRMVPVKVSDVVIDWRRRDSYRGRRRLTYCHLACNAADYILKWVVVNFLVPRPRSEPPSLEVVSLFAHGHLWTDEKDLLVQDNDSAVVADSIVTHGHADVENAVARSWIGDDSRQGLPAVKKEVALQAAIISDIRNHCELRLLLVICTLWLVSMKVSGATGRTRRENLDLGKLAFWSHIHHIRRLRAQGRLSVERPPLLLVRYSRLCAPHCHQSQVPICKVLVISLR